LKTAAGFAVIATIITDNLTRQQIILKHVVLYWVVIETPKKLWLTKEAVMSENWEHSL
jgi:hypothetical protein